MARVHIFFLSIGLACLYWPAALASQASSKPDSVLAPTPPNIEVVPSAPSKTPEETALPSAKPQQPAPATPKNPVYMAETIRMQHAWIYSAIVPGAGQVYNGHYWKVPAMYAIFGALSWGVVYNHQVCSKIGQNKNQYQVDVEYFRRNRDLCAIFMGFLYIANIFDAYVGASLKTFNLSDDISMEVQPHVAPGVQDISTVGLSLSFKF